MRGHLTAAEIAVRFGADGPEEIPPHLGALAGAAGICVQPPVDLGALWCRPWYRLAAVLLRERADVMVHDPDASEVEVYSDGIGTITVVPSVALGWAIVVHEAEPDDEDAEEAG